MLLKKILIWGKTVLTYFNVKINLQFCTFMGKKYQLFLVNEGKKNKKQLYWSHWFVYKPFGRLI